MAEKKDMVEGAKKPESTETKGEKKSFGKRISTFFREYKSEFKKITWSSKKDVIKNTSVVITVVVASAAVVVALDWIFSQGLRLLANLI